MIYSAITSLDGTVLNFANERIAGAVREEILAPGARVADMFSGKPFATVEDFHSLAELATSHRHAIEKFEFRLEHPTFLGDQLRIEGIPAADGRSAGLTVASGSAMVHATAKVVYA